MLQIGKIPPELLERIVLKPATQNHVQRSDIVLRPKTGEDCSAIDTQGELCVFSTDPITGATKDAGYLAVQINCNDIFSSGAEPVGILLTVLLPPQSNEQDLENLMQGALQAAEELQIEILGGHTEVTAVVNQPVISATIIGKTHNRHMICTSGGQAGQDVVMTKWAGLEGTAILAKEHAEILSTKMNGDLLIQAQNMKQYLSVGKESKIAVLHGATAMHDATEGGILGAVWELADCSNLDIIVDIDAIPIQESTKQICALCHISPLRLISSGCMVIATENGNTLVETLQKQGISAAVIGKLTPKGSGKYILSNGKKEPLQQPQSDALYQAYLD